MLVIPRKPIEMLSAAEDEDEVCVRGTLRVMRGNLILSCLISLKSRSSTNQRRITQRFFCFFYYYFSFLFLFLLDIRHRQLLRLRLGLGLHVLSIYFYWLVVDMLRARALTGLFVWQGTPGTLDDCCTKSCKASQP